MPQYRILLQCLLQTPSGGRLPVLLVSSLLHAIRETFELDWDIQCQDINVSDHASSASGDITIGRGDDILMVIEVTQRPVDEARILSTFMTKIAPAGIRDYLFLVNLDLIGDDAKRRAERYFAQGHDVNFLDLEDWILNSLATIGQPGRNAFSEHLHAMLSAPGIPQYVIVAWNSAIDEVTSA